MSDRASDQHDRAAAPGSTEAEPNPGEPGQEARPEAGGESAGDVEALRREAEDNWNKYLRAVAELENLRKRGERELEMARKYGVERLAQSILPVRDSLEAGLAADHVDVKTLLEGKSATLRLLDQALEQAGISEVDPHGEPFDPARHEAIGMLPSETAEPNTVLEVVQKGYRIHDRLLRPARVRVASEPQAGDGA